MENIELILAITLTQANDSVHCILAQICRISKMLSLYQRTN